MAEHVATLLAPTLGRLPAHALIARASARASSDHITLLDALLTDPESTAKLASAHVSQGQLKAALDPHSYLGATSEFIARALTAHAERSA
jgi:3-carboxy-cis,cis-muconate cycloisomerase